MLNSPTPKWVKNTMKLDIDGLDTRAKVNHIQGAIKKMHQEQKVKNRHFIQPYRSQWQKRKTIKQAMTTFFV